MQPTMRGIMYILISNLAFCGMSCLVKYASSYSAFTSTLYRCIIGMGVIGILALTGKTKLTFNNRNGLFFRGLYGGIAICTGFISIEKLGLIKASVIINSYPVFATLFSIFLLKEKVNAIKILSIFSSFMGMVLIVSEKNSGHSLFSIGVYEIISISGAMLGGLAVVYVKKLQETDSSATIFFAQCLMGFWIVLIPAGNSTGSKVNIYSSIILLGIGLMASIGQLIFTQAYRYISVATGSILVMLSPVLNFFAGVVFFHEQIRFNTIIGTLITITSCTVLLIPGKKVKTC